MRYLYFQNGKLESDLKQGDEIDLVTADTNEDGAEVDDVSEGSSDDDYDIITEATNDLGSAPRYPTSNCRGDDAITCPKNPHVKICSEQFCDQVADCPDGEDESPENCPQGEHKMKRKTMFYGKYKCEKQKKEKMKKNEKITRISNFQ